MNSKLFILPLLALLFNAVAIVTQMTIKEMPLISYILWGISITCLLLWFILDREGFQKVFSRKGAKYGATSGITVVLGIAIIIGIGFLTNRARFNKSFDVTRDGLNTLSDQSIKAIGSLAEKDAMIDIKTFFQDELKKQKFSDLLALYQAEGLQASVEHIDPQEDPTKAIAANVTTADTVILKLGENESRLTSFTEEKMTNGFLKLLKSKAKTIAFTIGHGEKDLASQEADGYALAKQELESERFLVTTLNLLEQEKVGADVDLLVIAGPKYDFRDNEIKLVADYLDQGKPLFVMLDALTSLPILEKFIENYGLKVNPDILLLSPEDPRAQLLGQNNAIVTEFDQFSAATKDFAKNGSMALVISNTRSVAELTDNEKKMKPSLIAKTSEIIIGISNVRAPSDLENLTQDRIKAGPFAVLGVATGQVGGSEVAAKEDSSKKDLPLEGTKASKELRLAVLGSSDIISNIGAQRGENVDLFLNVVNYLSQDESFISIRPKDESKSSLDMSSASSQLLLLFFSYLYPTLFLGGGVFYWIMRRRA